MAESALASARAVGYAFTGVGVVLILLAWIGGDFDASGAVMGAGLLVQGFGYLAYAERPRVRRLFLFGGLALILVGLVLAFL